MAPAPSLSQHVTVLSRCEVSPSPPAPAAGQPRALPLTFFDLVFWGFPPVQRLFFYDDPAGLVDVPGFLARDVPLFRDSLAAALHRFYPLAGKLPCELPPEGPGPEVVCSDGDSVRLTVAVAGEDEDDDFRDLAGDQPRDTARLRPLLPPLSEHHGGSRDVFAVQLTVFPRAGICVGTTLHHAVADGSGYAHFVRTWAAFHRRLLGGKKKDAIDIDVAPPLLDRGVVRDDGGRLREAFLRDHRALAAAGDTRLGDWDLSSSVFQGSGVGGCVQLATFRFTGELLRKLGKRVEAETSARGCSPYAVACGAAWAGIAQARGVVGIGIGTEQHFGFVTGCKPRASPPVPAGYFGNCLGLCRVRVEGKELTASAASAAIWREIEGLAEPGRALRGARGWVRCVRESAAARAVTVAGSPKLGMYAAADMGGAPWGRPRKVEIASVERTGALALAEDGGGSGGGGIEVGVALPQGEMEAFRAFFSDLVASCDSC